MSEFVDVSIITKCSTKASQLVIGTLCRALSLRSGVQATGTSGLLLSLFSSRSLTFKLPVSFTPSILARLLDLKL